MYLEYGMIVKGDCESPRPYCDEGWFTNTCENVPCVLRADFCNDNGDCTSPEVCDNLIQTCVTLPSTCDPTNARSCPGSFLCSTNSPYQCVGGHEGDSCTVLRDCYYSEGFVCDTINSQCAKISDGYCAVNLNCNGGSCNINTNRCTNSVSLRGVCQTNSDCSQGNLCTMQSDGNGICGPIECFSNLQCENPSPSCNVPGKEGACWTCSTNLDCDSRNIYDCVNNGVTCSPICSTTSRNGIRDYGCDKVICQNNQECAQNYYCKFTYGKSSMASRVVDGTSSTGVNACNTIPSNKCLTNNDCQNNQVCSDSNIDLIGFQALGNCITSGSQDETSQGETGGSGTGTTPIVHPPTLLSQENCEIIAQPSTTTTIKDFHYLGGNNPLYTNGLDGKLYHWNPNQQQWTKIMDTGSVKGRIHYNPLLQKIYSIGSDDNKMWSLNLNDNPKTWREFARGTSAPEIEDFQYFSNSVVYAVGIDHNVYKWDGTTWTQINILNGISEGVVKGKIQVNRQLNYVYSIDMADSLWRLNLNAQSSPLWTKLTSPAITDFVVVNEDEIYGIGFDGNIYKSNGLNSWTQITIRGTATNPLVAITNIGSALQYDSTNADKKLVVSAEANGAIYRCSTQPPTILTGNIPIGGFCSNNWECSSSNCIIPINQNLGTCGESSTASCTSNEQCAQGQTCTNGVCANIPPPPEEIPCTVDDNCEIGQICNNGVCANINTNLCNGQICGIDQYCNREATPDSCEGGSADPDTPCNSQIDCGRGSVCSRDSVDSPIPFVCKKCDIAQDTDNDGKNDCEDACPLDSARKTADQLPCSAVPTTLSCEDDLNGAACSSSESCSDIAEYSEYSIESNCCVPIDLDTYDPEENGGLCQGIEIGPDGSIVTITRSSCNDPDGDGLGVRTITRDDGSPVPEQCTILRARTGSGSRNNVNFFGLTALVLTSTIITLFYLLKSKKRKHNRKL